MDRIVSTLEALRAGANMRALPPDTASQADMVDLSGNDYLGIAENVGLRNSFLDTLDAASFLPAASASRLLGARQNDFYALEKALGDAYGRPALLFNSGYHANTGILQSLGSKSTLFVADKLVHASIIDGMNLAEAAGSRFVRFRHNDYNHLMHIMTSTARDYNRVVIVAESVYSMDGDNADIDALLAARDSHRNAMIYLDEAHATGVAGIAGLGMARSHPRYDDIDIVVGTFGKALASAGAYAVTNETLRQYLINRCRSLIFSTALPPVTVRWSLTTLRYAMGADTERQQLDALAQRMAEILPGDRRPAHIMPLIVGNPADAVALSRHLAENGYKVLPIRTPTVPPGTDRLRFSLSAAIKPDALEKLGELLSPDRMVRP